MCTYTRTLYTLTHVFTMTFRFGRLDQTDTGIHNTLCAEKRRREGGGGKEDSTHSALVWTQDAIRTDNLFCGDLFVRVGLKTNLYYLFKNVDLKTKLSEGGIIFEVE